MRRVCAYLLVFVIVSVFGKCVFDAGKEPAPGECEGAMARTIAKREAVSKINHGCDIDEVFYNAEGAIKCGACIPGYHGDQIFTGFTYSPPDVEFCWEGHNHLAWCEKVGFTPSSRFSVSCKENEYCSNEGKCEKKTALGEYSEPCNLGKCSAGLQCIENMCVICKNDINLSYQGNKVGRDILEAGTCSGGKYKRPSPDNQSNSNTAELLETVIIGILLLSIILKTGIVQFGAKNLAQRCRIYIQQYR